MNYTKRLLTDGVIYGIGGVVTRALSLLIIPVYTKILSPQEVGLIELYSLVSILFVSIVGMGTEVLMSLEYSRHKTEKEKNSIIRDILKFRIITGVPSVLLFLLIIACLNKIGLLEVGFEVLTIVLIHSLFYLLLSQAADVNRLRYKPIAYLTIMLGYSILSTASILILLAIYELGIDGYFVGLMMSSITIAIAAWFWYLKQNKNTEYKKILNVKGIFKFGLPYGLSAIIIMIMINADKYFVYLKMGNEGLGLYSIVAKVVMLVSFSVETFRRAWLPIGMDNLYDKNGPNLYNFVIKIYILFAAIGIVVATLVSEYFVILLSDQRYLFFINLFPIMAWSVVLQGLFVIAAAGIIKKKNNLLRLKLIAIGTSMILAIDFLMLRYLDDVIYPYATFIGILFTLYLLTLGSNNYISIDWDYASNLMVIISGVLMSHYVLSFELLGGKYMLAGLLAVWLAAMVVHLYISLIRYNKNELVCEKI